MTVSNWALTQSGNSYSVPNNNNQHGVLLNSLFWIHSSICSLHTNQLFAKFVVTDCTLRMLDFFKVPLFLLARQVPLFQFEFKICSELCYVLEFGEHLLITQLLYTQPLSTVAQW